MRELTPTYAGKATLKVLEAPLQQTKAAWAELEQEGSHGLIGFAPDGSVKVVLEGHKFDKATVEAKLQELLGS